MSASRNVVDDSGFEGSGVWAFNGASGTGVASDDQYTGQQSGRLALREGDIAPPGVLRTYQTVNGLIAGEGHTVKAWVKVEDSSNAGKLGFAADDVVVSWFDVTLLAQGEWVLAEFPGFVPPSASMELDWRLYDLAGNPGSTTSVLLDDVRVATPRPLSVTLVAYQALLTALQEIDGTPPFRVALDNIYTGNIDLAQADDDFSVALVSSDGESASEPTTLNARKGRAVQGFRLKVWVRSDEPELDLMLLLDDIRLAVERQASPLLVVPTEYQNYQPVMTSVRTWSDPVRALDDQKRQRGIMEEINVIVDYEYERNIV